MKDDLGDRMKSYERAETGRVLDARLPIYARIDGRGFSRFTRGMQRPFDSRMSYAMVKTACDLVEETGARIGYTQSDEISLLWLIDESAPPESQIFFDGKLLKLTSVLASYATAAFTRAVLASEPQFAKYAERLPHFDARVFSLPSREEGANAMLWRQLDATRNAIQMAAQSAFSHKTLHGRSTSEMLAMLRDIEIDFDNYPSFFTRGTFVRRVTFERPYKSEELERIPEKHRPDADALVTRSEIRSVDLPNLLSIANRAAVIFDGSEIRMKESVAA
jgi:tRNA(His) guanylyltransferase